MADPKVLRVLQGFDGWSFIPALVTDGERVVVQVARWTGGTGNPPQSGQYVGPVGLVSNIGDAVNIKGDSNYPPVTIANELTGEEFFPLIQDGQNVLVQLSVLKVFMNSTPAHVPYRMNTATEFATLEDGGLTVKAESYGVGYKNDLVVDEFLTGKWAIPFILNSSVQDTYFEMGLSNSSVAPAESDVTIEVIISDDYTESGTANLWFSNTYQAFDPYSGPYITVPNIGEFCFLFDADNHTWGIITPDDVTHVSSLPYDPACGYPSFHVTGMPLGTTILTSETMTLTLPVGYSVISD